MSKPWLQLSLLGILMVFSIGCGRQDGPELATVTGKITLDGQPLPRVNIRFIPQQQGGSPSFGGTNAEGQYRLLFNHHRAGAMLGTHRVEIEPAEPEQGEDGKALPGVQVVKLPKKSIPSGGLTAEIKPGRNTVHFDLASR